MKEIDRNSTAGWPASPRYRGRLSLAARIRHSPMRTAPSRVAEPGRKIHRRTAAGSAADRSGTDIGEAPADLSRPRPPGAGRPNSRGRSGGPDVLPPRLAPRPRPAARRTGLAGWRGELPVAVQDQAEPPIRGGERENRRSRSRPSAPTVVACHAVWCSRRTWLNSRKPVRGHSSRPKTPHRTNRATNPWTNHRVAEETASGLCAAGRQPAPRPPPNSVHDDGMEGVQDHEFNSRRTVGRAEEPRPHTRTGADRPLVRASCGTGERRPRDRRPAPSRGPQPRRRRRTGTAGSPHA